MRSLRTWIVFFTLGVFGCGEPPSPEPGALITVENWPAGRGLLLTAKFDGLPDRSQHLNREQQFVVRVPEGSAGLLTVQAQGANGCIIVFGTVAVLLDDSLPKTKEATLILTEDFAGCPK